MIVKTKQGKVYKGYGIKFPNYVKLFQPLIWNYYERKWDETGVIKTISYFDIEEVVE